MLTPDEGPFYGEPFKMSPPKQKEIEGNNFIARVITNLYHHYFFNSLVSSLVLFTNVYRNNVCSGYVSSRLLGLFRLMLLMFLKTITNALGYMFTIISKAFC